MSAKGGSKVDQRRHQEVPLLTELTATLQHMFGDYDESGTLAVEILLINFVVHARRNGGISCEPSTPTLTTTLESETNRTS